MKTETKTVYLYKNHKYDFTNITTNPDYCDDDDEYLMISKPLEVEFELLPDQEIIQGAVNAIDKAIEKEKADSQVRLNAMDQRKQELLSICYDGDDGE